MLRCAVPLKAASVGRLGASSSWRAGRTGAGLIDLSDRVCRADPCPVAVDGMIVFRDSRHLTATYAESLAPDLERELLRFLPPSAGTPPAPAATPIPSPAPSPSAPRPMP